MSPAAPVGVALPSSAAQFEAVVAALMQPSAYPHAVKSVRRIDTHISVVLLTGEYAYKLKKPVRLPFLDFSSLQQRHALCLHEVQLNRRTAPGLYLGVEPVTRVAGQLRVGGAGEPLEYAVRMRQFADDARLDHVLESGALDSCVAQQLATDIAAFHACAEVAPSTSEWGTQAEVKRELEGNFEVLHEQAKAAGVSLTRLSRLRDDQLGAVDTLATSVQARRCDGHVRDCHGDLHLANIALLDGKAVAFDCIEFNEAFRWIDVMSDVAFLLMDLERRGASELSTVVLNRYLECSGDFDGLAVLRLYQGYRAMVRAKVEALRLAQGEPPACDLVAGRREVDSYLALAERYATHAPGTPPPALIITCGLSGAGKSYLAARLACATGAIVIRSDVERRRLFDVKLTDTAERYGAPAARATYARVAACARAALDAGCTVIADAAFLRREQRDAFAALAHDAGYRFGIVHVSAPADTLRHRLLARSARGLDPSEADLDVLEVQLSASELPGEAESGVTHVVDTSVDVDWKELRRWLDALPVPA